MIIVKIGENIKACIIEEYNPEFSGSILNYSMLIEGTGDMYEDLAEYSISIDGEEINYATDIWLEYIGRLRTGFATEEQIKNYGIEKGTKIITTDKGVVYYECKNNEFVIPDGITSITNNFMFQQIAPTQKQTYNMIKTIFIGKDVERIGDGAFASGSTYSILEKIIFDNGTRIKCLGNNCFTNNSELKTIDIKEAKPTLGTGCFSFCANLEYINFGAYLENIPHMCFAYCSSLIEFNKGNTIKSFDNSSGYVFIYCNNITYFTFHENCAFNNTTEFYVELNSGSDCDENGFKITEIRGLSTHAQCYKWSKKSNRKVVCSQPYLVLKHLEKNVIIKCYPKPWENIDKYYPIKHKERIWYLKTSKLEDTAISPLVVHDRSEKVYISY